MDSATAKRGYQISEAVHYTGRPRSAIYEAIRDGQLRSFKVGARRMLLREDLDAWLDDLSRAPQVGA